MHGCSKQHQGAWCLAQGMHLQHQIAAGILNGGQVRVQGRMSVRRRRRSWVMSEKDQTCHLCDMPAGLTLSLI